MSGDFISRQAAIDALGERPLVWTSDDDYALGERNQYDIDRLAIETVPSSDVREVKRGRWILTEDEDYEYCTCSECGYQNGENWMNGSDIPFCANCGADMREDGE